MARTTLFVFTAATFILVAFPIFHSVTHSGTLKNASRNLTSWPDVVWLANYPNSGARFVLSLIHASSQRATATNYKRITSKVSTTSFQQRENFLQYSENGPFRESAKDLPQHYILTKTHCSGFCDSCKPSKTYATPEDFYESCGKGSLNSMTNGQVTNRLVSYDPSLAKKMVHLIRNPFDNVVARFHFFYLGSKSSKDLATPTRKDFLDFCQVTDSMHVEEKHDFFGDKLYSEVPCHLHFYRYIQWHNNAFEMATKYMIPHILIHYEDFATNYNRSLTRLVDFLHLDVESEENPKFLWNGGYSEHYTVKEKEAVRAFLREHASQETYYQIQRYLYP